MENNFDNHKIFPYILNFVYELWNFSPSNVLMYTVSHSFHFNNYLKQLYMNNKTEHFSYKYGYGMTHMAFTRRAGLGYRQTALGY